jgi:hypothetical protein
VNDAMVATAPPNLSLLGRITEQWGKSALAECRIETRTTLFDISEVERCCVGDYLNVVCIPKIGIGPGDGGAVGDVNGLRKRGAKIRTRRAAIADEPTGVDVEVH